MNDLAMVVISAIFGFFGCLGVLFAYANIQDRREGIHKKAPKFCPQCRSELRQEAEVLHFDAVTGKPRMAMWAYCPSLGERPYWAEDTKPTVPWASLGQHAYFARYDNYKPFRWERLQV